MSKKVKELQKEVEELKSSIKIELYDEKFSTWIYTETSYESKISKILQRLSGIDSSIQKIEEKLWKLENPFKFNVGDLVKINLRSEFSDVYSYYTINKINDKNIYKIISQEFVNRNKNYEIFDCKNSIKKMIGEQYITLYKDEK
jgi:hypothetical protein